MNGSYVIIGDTERYDGCLVCVAGSYDNAEVVLCRMLNNPTENDKKLITGHTNLRIDFVENNKCWWNNI